jgi:hypothetical protein
MKKFFANISVLLVSIFIAVCFCEIVLRVALPVERKRSRYMATRNIFHYDGRNVQFDEDAGYWMRPNLKVRFSNSEFNTTVSTNSFGARDDERSLKDPDMILLGDSFTFGSGVEKSQTCESYLESLSHSTVLNLGLSGYGTIQEFLLLERFAATQKSLKGRLIVFLFYPNDLSENLGYGFNSYPTIYTENGEVKFSKCAREGYEKWLYMCNKSMPRGLNKLSYFVSEMRSLIKQTKNRLKGKKSDAPSKEDGRVTEEKKKAFRLIVGRIKAFADKEGPRVVFIYCPSASYYQDRAKSIDDASIEIVRPVLSKASIPLIDLRSVLSEEDYYKYDGHWRSSGNYKAASVIKKIYDKEMPPL